MNTKVIPNIHQLGKDIWLVETPVHSGLRTVSLHLREGSHHVWLWVKLAIGATPKAAFPQFQRPCPALEDSELHRDALPPETEETQVFGNKSIEIGSEKFIVDGDCVMASGFAETDKTLTVQLSSSAPVFRWQ